MRSRNSLSMFMLTSSFLKCLRCSMYIADIAPSYYHTQMTDNHPQHSKPHSKLQSKRSRLMNSTRQVLPISGNIHLTDEFNVSEQPPLKKGPMKAYGRRHNNSFQNTPAVSGKASSSYVAKSTPSSQTTSSNDSLIDESELKPESVSVFSSDKASALDSGKASSSIVITSASTASSSPTAMKNSNTNPDTISEGIRKHIHVTSEMRPGHGFSITKNSPWAIPLAFNFPGYRIIRTSENDIGTVFTWCGHCKKWIAENENPHTTNFCTDMRRKKIEKLPTEHPFEVVRVLWEQLRV